MLPQRFCKGCGVELKIRHKIFFCSNHCQRELEYSTFIRDWKIGAVSGGMGVLARGVSSHVVRYLRGQFGKQCVLCGWNKVNPMTGRVPLEIDHIDGDSENNSESNLRLICPNCHSLTPNFRNLNKGKGRKWRMDKYIKNR